MELIHNGENKNLVSKVFPDGSPMREYISGADIKQLDTEFESYLRTMGKSHGYHLYHVSDVENIYEIRYYLFKFDRQPIIAKFEVYEPKDKWRLQSFNIDFSLDKYMEESAKKIRDSWNS